MTLWNILILANGANKIHIRYQADDVKYHSKRLIDILTGITN